MARITPCRVVKLPLFLLLVLIWLWFTLPSPTISPQERPAYIQNELASGRPLHTVLRGNRAFNPKGMWAHAYIFRWQLTPSPSGQSVWLEIGNSQHVDLTKILDEAKEYNSRKSSTKEWVPYVGKALEIGGIASTDYEFNEICLPWFHDADKHLITHEMHGLKAGMVVQFVVPEDGRLELWLESAVRQAKKVTLDSVHEIDGSQLPETNFLILERLRSADDQWRHMATFTSTEMKSVADVQVADMQGDLLSKTYPIRAAIFVVYSPLFAVVYVLLSYVVWFVAAFALLAGAQILLACVGITLFCWLRAGRPNFWLWSQDFRLTRWLYRRRKGASRRVWGPAGPVWSKRAKKMDWDEEASVGLQRPQTVKLGRAWDGEEIASRSPV